MSQPAEDPLVTQMFDGKARLDAQQHEKLARAIKELTPDEAAFFLAKVERAFRKRRLQITGYLVAMVAWLVAMVLALLYFGTQQGFVAWVFVVPFGIVGVVLYGFGRWADAVGRGTRAGGGA